VEAAPPLRGASGDQTVGKESGANVIDPTKGLIPPAGRMFPGHHEPTFEDEHKEKSDSPTRQKFHSQEK